MANIKVTLDYELTDGQSLTFKAPCDCTAVTGLIVYYPTITENESTTTSKTFTFKDAHGNDLTSIGNLFTTDAYVKVILDITNNYAYIQNADTNGYLETKIGEKYVKPSSGIPKTDFTSEVQTSLGKADTAVQISEAGTNGIWTYIKYSNGFAECWGSVTEANHTFETAWGTVPLYISSAFEYVDYPFEFINRPNEQAIIRSSNGTGMTYAESGGTGINTTTHTARYNIARPEKVISKLTFTIDYMIKGYWK